MILVTGATGIVGSEVCKQLMSQEIELKALKKSNSDIFLLHGSNIEWCDGDVLDVPSLDRAMAGVNTIIHCAAIVSFDRRDDEYMMHVNVDGTQNVVNCALEHGVKNLIHISSIAALGRNKDKKSIDESVKWEESPLNTTYAKSKYLSEVEVRRGESEGLNVAIVNPSVVLAAGDGKRSSSQLLQYVWDERRFYLDGYANLVDVRDVASVVLRLIGGQHWGGRFILNGARVHYEQLFADLANRLDKKVPNFKVKPATTLSILPIINFLSFLSGKPRNVSKEMLKTMKEDFVYVSDKVESGLDFQFRELEESLDWVCVEFKKVKGAIS